MLHLIKPIIESVEVGHFPMMAAPLASLTPSSRPLVAVIDSGVDPTHPALSPYIWRNPAETSNGKDDDKNGLKDDVQGWDWIGSDNKPNDENGHGTHVAGIVVQGGCDVMSLRVLDRFSSGTEANVARAIRYAVAMGAKAICLSLGGSNDFPQLRDAIWDAQKKAVIVAAAGNSAVDIRQPQYRTFPATYSGVLSVAALDGSRLWSSSNVGAWIAAPGRGIYSTLPNGMWGKYSGTSMAAPAVAAAAALVGQKRPEWNPAQIFSRLVTTADKFDPRILSGRLNLSAALKGL